MNRQKVLLFIGLTFGFDWLLAGLFYWMGGNYSKPAGQMLGVAYMFVPMIIAIILQKYVYHEGIKEPLGISFRLNRWFLVAWLLPPIIAFATMGISLLLPGVHYSPEMTGFFQRFAGLLTPEQVQQTKAQLAAMPVSPVCLILAQGLVAGITINALAGFGEELGWRGFLQKELAVMGFWKASLLTGFIWGIWHLPLILQGHNYPQHPVAGVFMMIAWCMLLAPIFSYIRLKSGSVIAAAILHGTLNATPGLAIMLIAGGNDLLVGITGLAGFIVLLAVNLVLVIFDHRLAREAIVV